MIHQTLPLWGPGAYLGAADDGFEPSLSTYVLEGARPRPAVLICPGGCYTFRSARESEPIALQFNAAGFHAFVLGYSVAPRRHPLPLLDVSRAVCLLRGRAAEWRIRPGALFLVGFSAGGHLAAHLGTCWNRPEALLSPLDGRPMPGISAGANRPDGLILCYPVISSGPFAYAGLVPNLLGPGASDEEARAVSLELAVGPQVPPAFLWHSGEDEAVPLENSLLFAQALRKAGLPFELHVYPWGAHGLSLATPETSDERHGVDPHLASWMGLCVEWISGVAKL